MAGMGDAVRAGIGEAVRAGPDGAERVALLPSVAGLSFPSRSAIKWSMATAGFAAAQLD